MTHQKTYIAHFRITSDERAKFEQAASREGINISDFFRRALDHYLASLPHPPDGTAVPIIYQGKEG